MSSQGVQIWRTAALKYTTPSKAFSKTLPICERKIQYYTDIDRDVTVDQGYVFMPRARNNPLFDAFFFVVRRKRVEIWVLQYTMSKSAHLGSAAGYDLVETLRKKAMKTHPQSTIDLSYVLVVPKRIGVAAAWKVPAGWRSGRSSGSVYVQYLDVLDPKAEL